MIQPKKIIIIGSAYPLRGGGIASYNERLAREFMIQGFDTTIYTCLLYTSPSPRDRTRSRMPSSA